MSAQSLPGRLLKEAAIFEAEARATPLASRVHIRVLKLRALLMRETVDLLDAYTALHETTYELLAAHHGHATKPWQDARQAWHESDQARRKAGIA